MVPKRSAIAPANGWPMPQRIFWIARANPNTSRPQSLACDMGLRKKPSVARGQKLIIEMKQPHTTITTGVRHPIVKAFDPEEIEMAMTREPVRKSDNNRLGKTPGGCLYGVAPSSSNENWTKRLPPTHGS